jgi:hypothetical protein
MIETIVWIFFGLMIALLIIAILAIIYTFIVILHKQREDITYKKIAREFKLK